MNAPLTAAKSDAITKARARRLVSEVDRDSQRHRAADRCDCGLALADCARIGARKAADKRAALKLFEVL